MQTNNHERTKMPSMPWTWPLTASMSERPSTMLASPLLKTTKDSPSGLAFTATRTLPPWRVTCNVGRRREGGKEGVRGE